MIPIKYLPVNWRIKFYRFQHQLRRKWKTPLCYVIGHDTWEDHDWGGGYLKCSRCKKTLKVLWKPTYSDKAGKDN